MEWNRRRTPTGNVLVAVEGTCPYGVRLTNLFEVERLVVCEEDNQRALAEHVQLIASGNLDISGVRPVAAVIILASYSHHRRVRSEAAFAALADASPISASSGSTNGPGSTATVTGKLTTH